ncbi:MAG: ABC transporter substrate-binding protein, partial [Paracoccaceae bacterium]
MSAVGLWLALIVAPPPALADSTTSTRLVISNSDTDWGLAAPYLQAPGGLSYMLTHYVFDNLVGQISSGALAPELASEWQISDDGMSVDVTVDPDARWHDGRDVTSSDVTFTFAYMAEHPHVYVSLDNVAGTEVLSPDHLRISLHHP